MRYCFKTINDFQLRFTIRRMVIKGKSSGKLSKEIEEVGEETHEVRIDVDYAIATGAGYTIEGFETGYGKLTEYLSVAGTAYFRDQARFGGVLSVAEAARFMSYLSTEKYLQVEQYGKIKQYLSVGTNLIVGSTLSIAGKIEATGGMDITSLQILGNLVVRGNLNVVGNTTYTNIESETVRIQDNIIHLNSQVSGDNSNTQNLTNDIGWVGQTTISGTQSYVGTVWDYSKGKIKFLERAIQQLIMKLVILQNQLVLLLVIQ